MFRYGPLCTQLPHLKSKCVSPRPQLILHTSPHPNISILGSCEQEAAVTGQVHPRDPANMGSNLAQDATCGEREETNVA